MRLARSFEWLGFCKACVAGITLALVACAPVRVRETPQALSAQSTREQALASQTSWTISAHIAVSGGGDGGSGELEWQQSADRYVFTVRAPVTGRTWKLSGDAGAATLEGVDPQSDQGASAEQLLHDRLGWDVPLHNLGAWVRGVRAGTSTAKITFDAANLPAVIEQDGWRVEYRDWFTDRDPPLPRRVFASHGNARVKMAIERWSSDG